MMNAVRVDSPEELILTRVMLRRWIDRLPESDRAAALLLLDGREPSQVGISVTTVNRIEHALACMVGARTKSCARCEETKPAAEFPSLATEACNACIGHNASRCRADRALVARRWEAAFRAGMPLLCPKCKTEKPPTEFVSEYRPCKACRSVARTGQPNVS